jgi:DNA polymerase III epsilon subunit-like protein
MRITVIDTETTGIIPKDFQHLDECPYMVQIGSITYDTKTSTIVHKINNIIRIDDHINISQEVSDINSITKERCINEGVNIVDILHKINYQFKDSDMIVAHNLEFDINILNYEYMRHDIPFEYLKLNKNMSFCTMSNGTQMCKIKKENSKGHYYKWPKLEELHYHLFGTGLQNLHDAYNDLIICLRCYMFMNFKIDVTNDNEVLKNEIHSLLVEAS